MSFSDQDLKRLKTEMHQDFTGWWPHNVRSVEALLARLEAAEKVCNKAPLVRDTAYLEPELSAWRKACGK